MSTDGQPDPAIFEAIVRRRVYEMVMALDVDELLQLLGNLILDAQTRADRRALQALTEEG